MDSYIIYESSGRTEFAPRQGFARAKRLHGLTAAGQKAGIDHISSIWVRCFFIPEKGP